MQTRKNTIGTPTWTGKFGSAGKFGLKKRKLLNSSSTILQNLRQKNELTESKKKDDVKVEPDRKQIMENLVEYLGDQKDNFSTSNDIIKNVKLSMSTENEMIMIRSMLREIANWDSSRKGWKLKDEFLQQQQQQPE